MLEVPEKNLIYPILHTLAYSDVFDYPLTAFEIHRYLVNQRATMEEVTRALDEMITSHSVARVGGYFTLPNRESIVEIRERRAEIASRLWKKAARYGKIIASLPFVRMVAVTGSLAMNNAEEGKDIDYMIVTAPNRLWTCRALTLLIARFAKLEGISLCPNYLVTTIAREFSEHSLYVAHELAQMIPLSGMEVYDEMCRLNAWMDEYFPNANSYVIARSGASRHDEAISAPVRRLLRPLVSIRRKNTAYSTSGARNDMQSIIEFILNLLPIHGFETWEMNRKIKKLTREQSSSSESNFSAEVCKGHVDKHGERTENAMKQRLELFSHSDPLPKGEGVRVAIESPLPAGEG